MKVIRGAKGYVQMTKYEIGIYEFLNKKDPENKYGFLKVIDSFDMGPNFCVVFERTGPNLWSILKKNHRQGFSIKLIQSFARQLLYTVGYLHSLRLTHTDIKPENVVLASDELKRVPTKKIADGYFEPVDDKIKLIDFGTATFDNAFHPRIITTRQYRAPEVILGFPWNEAADVWSIGCVLVTLASGMLLFPTHDDQEHLAMIDKERGPFPDWMINKADFELQKFFYLNEDHFKTYGSYFDWEELLAYEDKAGRLRNYRGLDELVSLDHPALNDLLKKLLEIDPNKRISCEEALKHPFFKMKYDK